LSLKGKNQLDCLPFCRVPNGENGFRRNFGKSSSEPKKINLQSSSELAVVVDGDPFNPCRRFDEVLEKKQNSNFHRMKSYISPLFSSHKREKAVETALNH